MNRKTVFIVDDILEDAEELAQILKQDRSAYQYTVATACSFEEAVRRYDDLLGQVDVIVLDLVGLPHKETFPSPKYTGQESWLAEIEPGVRLAERLRRMYLHVYPPRLIVRSMHETRVESHPETRKRLKFHDNIRKGSQASDRQKFIRAVKTQCKDLETIMDEPRTVDDLNDFLPRIPFLTRHEPLQKQIEHTLQMMTANSKVLLLGETGTGKGQLARVLHYNGVRYDDRFSYVDLGSLKEELFESELWGHEKGSFTNATVARRGHLRMANPGTILLDEIGDLPKILLKKFRGFLDNKVVIPVGEDEKGERVNLLIIATSEQSPDEIRIEKNIRDRFSLKIALSDLSQRPEDIGLYVEYCIYAYCDQVGIKRRPLAPDALEPLIADMRPRSFRELNTILVPVLACLRDNPPDVVGEEHLYPRREFDGRHTAVVTVTNPSRRRTATVADPAVPEDGVVSTLRPAKDPPDITIVMNDPTAIPWLHPALRGAGDRWSIIRANALLLINILLARDAARARWTKAEIEGWLGKKQKWIDRNVHNLLSTEALQQWDFMLPQRRKKGLAQQGSTGEKETAHEALPSPPDHAEGGVQS